MKYLLAAATAGFLFPFFLIIFALSFGFLFLCGLVFIVVNFF